MTARAIVNDLTIQAATVNGSGSQSSNLVITKALFNMGIPVAPKNVFPSNIEGLPTWYDIRVSPQGYLARSRTVDVLIALNPATWHLDVHGVRPGGAIIHEAALLPIGGAARDDVTFYPVPFARLAKERIVAKPDLRKYLVNMIYVGVVAHLLGIDLDAVEKAVNDQFRSKPKAAALNMDAVRIGVEYASAELVKADPYRVEPMDGTAGTILLDGNQAAALGCLMGGCTVMAWYPITPSSSLCESFLAYAQRYRTDPVTGERRYAGIQAEDELAAIGMVLGASWAGARAMTSTSGPGLSLMAEFVGLGYYAELPAVIFDVQRVGPSTGLPTRTMQGDLLAAHVLSHGDTRHPVLLPGTMVEAYQDAMAAFDLADRLQTPIFVLSDLDLGMNLWMTEPLPYPEHGFDRGKVLSAAQLEHAGGWARYRDVDGDGIAYRTLPGTDHPDAGFFTRGSGHDENAHYTESPEVYQRNMQRLATKIDGARTLAPAPVVDEAAGSVGIVAYGSSHHAVVEARDRLTALGLRTDYLRIRALPFHPGVAAFVERHERVYVVDQNRDGQMHGLLRQELSGALADRLHSIRHFNGVPIDAVAILEPLLAVERPERGDPAEDGVAAPDPEFASSEPAVAV